jgi:hypothetical protein
MICGAIWFLVEWWVKSIFLISNSVYRDTAAQLLSIPTKTIGPVGLLYVGQREMASVPVHDKQINIIGESFKIAYTKCG